MKLVAVIVCYHPGTTELLRNIRQSAPYADKLYVYKNSFLSKELLQGITALQETFSAVEIIGEEANLGIAGAANEVINCFGTDYTHLLVLDQDSFFAGESLARLKDYICQQPATDLSIYSPRIAETLEQAALPVQPVLEEVPDSITSGSVFNMALFRKIGLFNEKLFIDAIDYEFCYRAAREGIKTRIYNEAVLVQQFGYYSPTKLGFMTSNYSPLRTYTIVRNHIFMWRRYAAFFPRSHKKRLLKEHILSRFVKVILAEQSKGAKLSAILRGVYDGLTNKYGGIKRFLPPQKPT